MVSPPQLASGDKNTLHATLLVVGVCNCSGLKQDVRTIVWSDNVPEEIQFSATLALDCLKDAEGLREIAEKHPKEKVRQWAKNMLAYMAEKKNDWQAGKRLDIRPAML